MQAYLALVSFMHSSSQKCTFCAEVGGGIRVIFNVTRADLGIRCLVLRFHPVIN